MASSTTKRTASTIAINVIILMEEPKTFKNINEPNNEVGIVTRGTSVVFIFLKNKIQ